MSLFILQKLTVYCYEAQRVLVKFNTIKSINKQDFTILLFLRGKLYLASPWHLFLPKQTLVVLFYIIYIYGKA